MANYCRNCGSPVSPGAKFCRSCGCVLQTEETQASPQETINDPRQRQTADTCRFCGKPIMPGAKFCRNCGHSLTEADIAVKSDAVLQSPQTVTVQKKSANVTPRPKPASKVTRVSQPSPVKKTNICPFCGNPLTAGAKFCRSCGKSQNADALKETQTPSAGKAGSLSRSLPVQEQPASRTRTRRIPVQSPVRENMEPLPAKPQIQNLAASERAGEFELALPALPGTAMSTAAIPGPIGGILNSIGSFAGGILGIFRNPAALVGTLLLAALWFGLALLKNSDSTLVRALSWLTYAQGGLDRSGVGILGGMLGKGTVAAAFVSLFTGGLPKVLKGFGAFVTGKGRKRSFVMVIIGILVGAAVCIAFVGVRNISRAAAMPGIACVLLCLQALGGSSGRLYELVQSLTSKAYNDARTAVTDRCDGLLTGLTLGIALVTLLSLFR